MSDSKQPEWPKSFRWHTDYKHEPDIVTFYCDDETVTDCCGCIWSYSDCISCNAWVPTDQHKEKPAPAPSQDDVKAEVASLLSDAREIMKRLWFASDSRDDYLITPMKEAFDKLADAVERLAK